MQKVTVIPAATTNNNIFSGEYIEVLPSAGMLHFAFSAGGGAALVSDDVEIDVFCGGEVIATNFNPTASLAAEPNPIKVPDDFTLSCPGLPGDRIIAKVRNKDAAIALRLLWGVMFDMA